MNGTNQGSYILINSTVLNYYFQNYLNNQGVGINTFVYFSGIPWEDNPASNPYNPFESSPLFADAVTISYITGRPQVIAPGYTHIGICPGVSPVEDEISVGGYTPLPVGYLFTMFEYGWNGANGCSAGVGCSSGYYVGIIYNYATCKPPVGSQSLGVPYYNTTYYYGGSGWS